MAGKVISRVVPIWGDMMKTSDLERVISAYIDGGIPENKQDAIRQLIKVNEEAARCYREFTQLRDSIRRLPKVPSPVDFSQSVLLALQSRPIPDSATRHNAKKRTALRLSIRIGIVSLSLVLLITGWVLFRSNQPEPDRPGLVASRLTTPLAPEKISSSPETETPVREASPTPPQPADTTRRSDEKGWMTAPAPLALHGKGARPHIAPTLDSMLWVRCVPTASQEEKFVGEFLEYCMARSLNFKMVGKHIYEFRVEREMFDHFVKWLRSSPRTGGIVHMSDALEAWSNGHASFTPPTTEAFQESKPITMADELAIRFEIELNK